MLPLDEPHFIIDSNTRAITVPAEFKKNGIAVQGDDLAEIVYFEIDRYFDAVDFNNCEIYIQWELPKTKTQGVSPAYTKDISSQPGKLIFGWPISDAITQSSGSMKFSVQFYQLDDKDSKKLKYSFNTLTAQVNIQSSIGIDIMNLRDEQIDRVGDRLIDRIHDGEIVGGVGAASPVFDEDILGVYDLDDNGEYQLKALAYTTDTGGLTYVWEHADLEADNVTIGNFGNVDTENVDEEFVEIDKKDMVAGRVYWYMPNSDQKERYIATGKEKDNVEDTRTYYRRLTTCKITSTGAYRVVARNRITNSIAETASQIAIFPHPTIPIVGEIAASGIIGTQSADLTVAAQGKEHEVLTYQWERSENYKKPNDNADYAPISDATGTEYTPTEQGRYRVVVTSSRNGESVQQTSSVCRVTNAAIEPVVEVSGGLIFDASSLSDENCPTVEIDNSIDSDGYKVDWYVTENDKSGLITTTSLAYKDSGNFVVSMNPNNYLEQIKEITGEDNVYAWYYCTVTNEYNGTEATWKMPTTNKDSIFRVDYTIEPAIETAKLFFED